MFSPLEQFKVMPYLRIYDTYYDFTFSNFSLFLLISSLLTLFFLIPSTQILANKKDIVLETLYIKIEEIVNNMIGKTKYIPLIFIIFSFVLTNNLIGLIPYSFTVTSHIIYTLTFSLSIIIGITILGVYKHSYKFLNLFIPSGLNKGYIKLIIPLIFVIEVISYLSRIISLSVRLTANMISGHLLLHIITNFGIHLSIFLFFIPLLLLFPIYILEFAVCIIQSYVFTVLIVSYIKDVEYLH